MLHIPRGYCTLGTVSLNVRVISNNIFAGFCSWVQKVEHCSTPRKIQSKVARRYVPIPRSKTLLQYWWKSQFFDTIDYLSVVDSNTLQSSVEVTAGIDLSIQDLDKYYHPFDPIVTDLNPTLFQSEWNIPQRHSALGTVSLKLRAILNNANICAVSSGILIAWTVSSTPWWNCWWALQYVPISHYKTLLHYWWKS